MPSITLTTYWQKPFTLTFDIRQLLALKRHLQDESGSPIQIGGYAFRCMNGHLYFANGGTPGKYYFEMSLSEIISTINKAIAADL